MNFRTIEAGMDAAAEEHVAAALAASVTTGDYSLASNRARLLQLWGGVKPLLTAIAPLFPQKWRGVIKRFSLLLDLLLADDG